MIAIRGAIRVEANERSAIYHETQRLIAEIMRRNDLDRDRIVSAFFTMTPDLNADFPAYAARELGWTNVPMLGAQETAVPGAMDRMVRVLLHVDGEGPARHVYLGDAAAMRPDLAEPEDAAAGPASEGPSRESGASTGSAPEPTPPSFGPLLVLGLGLIGGSIALAVRRAGVFERVLGYDVDPEALELARRAGAIDVDSEDLNSLLDRASVVVLAIPVAESIDWIRDHGPRLKPGTVLVDAGSTKGSVLGAMNDLPESVQAVGAHPMAGSELGGMGAARPDLFFGATWALVRGERTGPQAETVAARLVETVGGRPYWIEADRHDRATAVTSHVPYLVSAALALQAEEFGDPEAVRRLIGPGLRDMTRLAGSQPALLAEILRTNWENIRAEAGRFQLRLGELVEELDARLTSDPVPVLEAARAARLHLSVREP